MFPAAECDGRTADSLSIGKNPDRAGFRLEAVQFLPQPRPQVFALFADAFRLEELTPPWLHFKVLTPAPLEIAAGTLIDYRLRLHGLPIRWQSRISAWEPPFRFVDEQIRGPYRRWWHEHIFDDVPGGTLVRDHVEYAVPCGLLADRLFVRRDLLKIFTFRREVLAAMWPFGQRECLSPPPRVV